MKEFKCPFCGSSNSEDAESCSVCKVDFRQLPEEIMSSETPKPKEQSDADNSSKEVPDWLADIIRRNRKPQGKMPFDSFADALMGIKSVDDFSDSMKKDFSGSEKIEEFLNEEKNLTEDSSDQNRGSLFSISHTSRKSIPNHKSDSIVSPSASEQRKNEEQQLEIPEVINSQDEISEDEELYRDFSVERPAQKWDLQPLAMSESYHQTDSAENGNQPGEFVPDVQADDNYIEAIQNVESDLNPAEKNEDYSTELSSGEKAPLVIAPDVEEPVISDEERLFNLPFEDDLSLTEEKITMDQPSDEAARMNSDLSTNQIEVMQEVPSSISEDSAKTSITTDFAPEKSDEKTEETAPAVESTDHPLENEPIEAPENTESDERDEQNLVSEFLSQINSDVPSSDSAAIQEPHDSSDGSLPEESENDIAELHSILSGTQESPDSLPTDSDLTEIDSGMQSASETVGSDTTADTVSGDNSIAETRDQFDKAEDSDAIPWNLFESADIFFPENRKEPIYSSFSKEKIPADYQDRNYQHRMITAVLVKLFQTENHNQPLKKADTRKTNKIIQTIFALLVFFGVITILISGVTDFIDLRPVDDKQVLSLSTFNYQISSLQEGEQALFVIDFTPGYIDELYAPTLKLIQNMTERNVKVRLATISPSSEMISQKIIMENPQISVENQGFFPGQVAAIQSLIALNADEIKAVFIISSNFQTLKTWIEQIHVEPVKFSLNILASAQMNSLLTPYYDSGLIESSLSGMIEKRYFYADNFSDKKTNREIFSVWFIILAAIIIYLTGCIDFSMAQATDKDGKHPEKNHTIQSDAKKHLGNSADTVIDKNTNRNEEKK